MLAWALAAVAAAPSIGAAVVAVPASDLDDARRVLDAAGLGDFPVSFVAGGASRSATVAAALDAADAERVIVHDAARILTPPELFERVLAALDDDPEAGGAIAAAPVTDTIKATAEPRSVSHRGGRACRDSVAIVTETLDRERLWAVQTPQAFPTAILRQALDVGAADLAAAGDDALLVERLGRRVLLVESSPSNLKLTTPADLEIVTALLASRA